VQRAPGGRRFWAVLLSNLKTGFTRRLRDRAIVEAKLPGSTREVTADGARGWRYPVETDLGDRYELFLWFDGSAYQVKVLSPDVEGRCGLHACHLFPDGRICLGDDSTGGMPTLDGAYAKSVLWANGFSAYERTAMFPF
jgi:hypothetical protein